MTSKIVKPTIIEPFGNHTATVIFLHGEEDESNSWAEKLASLIEPNYTRLIFPRAANIPISAYRGIEVPAWFDMYPENNARNTEDIEGYNKSSGDIINVIEREITGTTTTPGIPPSRIVLAGFSQGGSMAFHVGMNGPVVLGGVISISGHLPFFKSINWNEIQKPPLMICQGDSDPGLPINNLLAVSRIIRNCLDVVFHIYDGVEHESCEQELDDVQKFITECLPPLK